MPGTSGPIKGVSKKAVKSLNKAANKAPVKKFGKAVLKKVSTTRSIGYATTSKTNLPKFKKKKSTTKTGRKSLKQIRGR